MTDPLSYINPPYPLGIIAFTPVGTSRLKIALLAPSGKSSQVDGFGFSGSASNSAKLRSLPTGGMIILSPTLYRSNPTDSPS